MIDFKLAEFQLVGSVLRPTVGAGDGSLNSGEDCVGHLDGTVANLVAGTGFDLQTESGRTIKVTVSSATTVVSGQTGTVASISASAGSFVLTVNRADGIQPTGGTITVQTSTATAFLKSGHTAGTLTDVTAGATVDASGTFDAATQTLTARSVFLH